MTTEQKVIKNKVGLLKLSQELGKVSQACKAGCPCMVWLVVRSNLLKVWVPLLRSSFCLRDSLPKMTCI